MRMHSVAPEIKLQLEYQMTVVHVIMEPFGIAQPCGRDLAVYTSPSNDCRMVVRLTGLSLEVGVWQNVKTMLSA